MLHDLPPIHVVPLLRPLHGELIRLLRGLGADDWNAPTLAGAWRVRDVAAHLLDGDLRKIAMQRDSHALPAEPPPSTYAEVVAVINSFNASGVAYGARLSPRLLTDLLEITGVWYADVAAQLDPFAPSLYPVDWAGEQTSMNWMDLGREYTEWWHHQMQIRDAVRAPLQLLDDAWFAPLAALSMRALPRAYANVAAADGTAINIDVDGMRWCLTRAQDTWQLHGGAIDDATATIRLDRDVAWRVFFNAATERELATIVIEGDRALATPLFKARSVMV